MRVFKTAVFNSPDLLRSDRGQLITACLKCAEWDMLPDGTEAALVPYRTKKGLVIQPTPMIGGFLKKISAQKDFVKIFTEVVYKDDFFEYKIEAGKEILNYAPNLSPEKPINSGKGIVAVFGGIVYKHDAKYEIARSHEVERIMTLNLTKDGNTAIWKLYPEEMLKKYILKRMGKRVLNLRLEENEFENNNLLSYDNSEEPKSEQLLLPEDIVLEGEK